MSAFAGSTVRFRAAEADNLGTFNFAIDDVRCGGPVTESIPTLGEWGMISMAGVLGLAGLIFTIPANGRSRRRPKFRFPNI